jgi:hypothetical protein
MRQVIVATICRGLFFAKAPGLAELFESFPSSGDILVPVEDLDVGQKSRRQEAKGRVKKVVESDSGSSDSESESGCALPSVPQQAAPTRERHARGSKQAAQARIAKCAADEENIENHQHSTTALEF